MRAFSSTTVEAVVDGERGVAGLMEVGERSGLIALPFQKLFGRTSERVGEVVEVLDRIAVRHPHRPLFQHK